MLVSPPLVPRVVIHLVQRLSEDQNRTSFTLRSVLLLLILSCATPPIESQAQPRPNPFVGCERIQQIPREECQALEIFFTRTNGINWTNIRGWLLSNQPCEWFGVICRSEEWPRHVQKIRLSNNNVGGDLPSELSLLTELEEIIIENESDAGFFNALGGFVPNSFGDMHKLEVIRLKGQRIAGPVPSDLGDMQSLRELDLSNNRLDGPLPPELGNVRTLERIDLSGNAIRGRIPTEWAKLENLTVLRMADNELAGAIPEELGQLTRLEQLDLSGNRLTGRIPFSLSRLDSLIILLLDDNQLTDAPPPHFVRLASSLSICSLENNRPSFCIPDQQAFKSNGEESVCGVPLQNDCTYCSGSTTLDPPECSGLESLFYSTGGLDWIDNADWLAGTNPCAWHGVDCNQGTVTSLTLPDNNLEGAVPEELGALEGLTHIDLSGNRLSGELPLSVARLGSSIDSCNLLTTGGTLCIPDEPAYTSIDPESICGIPVGLACSPPEALLAVIAFNAEFETDRQRLTWQLSAPVANVRFDVEQKLGGSFMVIGSLDSGITPVPDQTYTFPLDDLEAGLHTFRIRLQAAGQAPIYSPELDVVVLGERAFMMEAPFPNPVHTRSTIRFSVQEEAPVQLAIYDVMGRRIRVLYEGTPGANRVEEVSFSGAGLAGGLYFVRLTGPGFAATEEVVIR